MFQLTEVLFVANGYRAISLIRTTLSASISGLAAAMETEIITPEEKVAWRNVAKIT